MLLISSFPENSGLAPNARLSPSADAHGHHQKRSLLMNSTLNKQV